MTHSLFTRQSGLSPRLFAILVVVILCAAVFAATAAADQPVKGTYTWSGGADLTGICDFTLSGHSDLTYTVTDFFDHGGVLVKERLHVSQQDTLSANGKTLVGLPYTYNQGFTFNSDGTLAGAVATGEVAKFPLPDGTLFISAGWVDWLAHQGEPAVLVADKGKAGDMAALCAALAP